MIFEPQSSRCLRPVAVLIAFYAAAVTGLSACSLGSPSVTAGSTPGGKSPAASPTVNAGELYSSGEPSPVATGSEWSGLPVLTPDTSFPAGETGAIVPRLGATYELTPEQDLVVEQARYALVKDCMAKKGFTLVEEPPRRRDATPATPMFDGYVGILDPNYAHKFGYKFDIEILDDAEGADIPDPPSAEYELALGGGNSDSGGCAGKAQSAVESGLPDDSKSSEVVSQIYDDAMALTEEDPEYLEALGKWVACMSEHGFEYKTPLLAFSAFDGFTFTTEQFMPSPAEVSTAVTDVECKRSSRLADTWRKVFWGHQLDLERENRPTLEVMMKRNDKRISNAEKALASVGG